MKKVLLGIFTVLAVLLFSDKVSALDPYYVGIYTNKYTKSEDQPFLMFAAYRLVDNAGDGVHAFDSIILRPMSDFTYAGESYTAYDDSWSDDQIRIIENGKKEKIDFDEQSFLNKKFLYYDIVKNGWFSGKDQFYLSNEERNKIDEDYDMIFEKTPSYKISDEGSILDEMMCTYGRGKDMIIKGNTQSISFRMIREKNDVIKYQVYLNYKPFFDEYVTIDSKYEGYDSAKKSGNLTINSTTYLKDHFSPRNFWDESTKLYGCPSSIMVGVNSNLTTSLNPYSISISTTTDLLEIGWDNIMDKEYSNSSTSHVFGISNDAEYKYPFVLYKDASYVEARRADPNETSLLCIFDEKPCDPSKDEKCNDKWDISLQESTYYGYELGAKSNKISDMINKNGFQNIYFDIKSGAINSECADLPKLYTNCFNGNKQFYGSGMPLPSTGENKILPTNTCLVSSSMFLGAQKFESHEYKNEQDKMTVERGMGEFNGYKYKNLICELKPRLNTYSETSLLRLTSPLDIYSTDGEPDGSYNILDMPCTSWGLGLDFTCTDKECQNELEYNVNKKIRETLYYCQDVYKQNHTIGTNLTLNEGRYKECKSFEEFYNSLVENGIINDLLSGCDLFEGEMKDKINFIFDIIKIAGPILAIILGMLDFTKVLVSGDADKEMKTAWKNFKVRLFAAFLLFIIPVILSLLINIFIGDKIGNNPYCGLFETSER